MTNINLAESIGIDRQGLIIEGKRFPFYISTQAVEVRADEDNLVGITVTLLAESVHIDPSLDVDTDGDVRLVTMGGAL